MTLYDELSAAKAEVSRIEAEINNLPSALKGVSKEEMSDIFHAIRRFFGGKDPEPNATAVESPDN